MAQPFPLSAKAPSERLRCWLAVAQLIGYIAVWGFALWFLPTLPVIVLLLAWALWFTPKIMNLNREFQDVRMPDDRT